MLAQILAQPDDAESASPEYFAVKRPAQFSQPLSKIGFGSCVHQDKPVSIFNPMYEEHPDLFLMIGDNIYGDTNDIQVLRAKYAKQFSHPEVKKFVTTYPIMAVWDDHDYGENDGDTKYSIKKNSQKLFMDVFSEPLNSPRRKQEGVYEAKIFGPPGQRVQVIMLDVRYFRSDFTPVPEEKKKANPKLGNYMPNPDPKLTMLGEVQWKWLKEQLKKPAEIRLIASGVQVISYEHGLESWGMLPHERQRFLDLLKEMKSEGVILLSGDQHVAELAWLKEGPLGYPLYDFTSSGLNQATSRPQIFSDSSFRLELVPKINNYGMIEIDWKQKDPEIRLIAKSEQGEVLFQRKLRLSELKKK